MNNLHNDQVAFTLKGHMKDSQSVHELARSRNLERTVNNKAVILYYSELKMTEELSKHVFKELNVLYKTIKVNLNVKCTSLPQTKQTISLVSMFLLNLS